MANSKELLSIVRCPTCKGKLLWNKNHCAECDTVFSRSKNTLNFLASNVLSNQNKQEISLHKTLATSYRKRYQSGFSRIYSAYWNRQFTDRLSASVQSILDCGCGTGDLLSSLLSFGHNVVGMDISPEMIDIASRLDAPANMSAFVCCPAETMPFASQTFDCVCFRGALHHMTDERKALAEAHRVLKNGGLLMLSEPNDDSLLLRLPRIVANRYISRFGNAHKAFHSAEWLDLIKQQGFKIEKTKYFSYLSQPLCGMSDMLPVLPYLPFAESIAEWLVKSDEFFSKVPLLQRQSFDLFVVAMKH